MSMDKLLLEIKKRKICDQNDIAPYVAKHGQILLINSLVYFMTKHEAGIACSIKVHTYF